MTKAYIPKIISANDLLSGDVIYMTADGWSHDVRHARVATSLGMASEMLEQAEHQHGHAVGPYTVDVLLDETNVPKPKLIREKMRVRGPSINVPGALSLTPEMAWLSF